MVGIITWLLCSSIKSKTNRARFLLLTFSVSPTRGTVYDQLLRACGGGSVEVGAPADGVRKQDACFHLCWEVNNCSQRQPSTYLVLRSGLRQLSMCPC